MAIPKNVVDLVDGKLDPLKKDVERVHFLMVGIVVVLFLGFIGVFIAATAMLIDSFRGKQASYQSLVDKVIGQNAKYDQLLDEIKKLSDSRTTSTIPIPLPVRVTR